MNNYFIILACGQSKRFNDKELKQFKVYRNKPLFEHSVDKALQSNLFKKIILVVNDKKKIPKKYSKKVLVIKGLTLIFFESNNLIAFSYWWEYLCTVWNSSPLENSIAQSIGTGTALFPISITVAPGEQHWYIDSYAFTAPEHSKNLSTPQLFVSSKIFFDKSVFFRSTGIISG